MFTPWSRKMAFGLLACLVALLACAEIPVASAELSYRIEPGQVVAYQVNIVAETPSKKDILSGVIVFTGKQAGSDQFTVRFVGGLGRKSQSKSTSGRRGPGGFPRPGGFGRPGGRPPGPPGFGPFGGTSFGGLSTSNSNTLVIGKRGEVRKLTGESQLPYLLGNLSILPFEALPKGDQKQWKEGTGITITEGSDHPFRGGPFRTQQTTTGGSESWRYRIQKDDGALVTIEKTYRLDSPAAKDGDETLEIDGKGTYLFNRELGVPESLDMKQTLVVSKPGSTVSIPMTVKWNRMSDEAYAAHQKQRAETIARLQKQAADRKAREAAAKKEAAGKKLSEDARKQILADLESSHWPNAANRLRRMKDWVPHPDDFDIAMVVKELRSHRVLGVNKGAKDLWAKIEALVEADRGQASSSGGENPFATEEEKQQMADPSVMRNWSDDTGTFNVDAQFVKLDGDAVVLKRKDGKELRVPIARLSQGDQAWVERWRKSAGPSNPFE